MRNIAPLRKSVHRWCGLQAILIILLFGGLTACDNANFVYPPLLSTPLLMGSNDFGVINVTYAKGYAETNLDSLVLCILRGGDMVTIVKRSASQEKINGVLDYWYQVKAGDQLSWIFGAWLDQYPLEMQAETASVMVREREFPNLDAFSNK